MKNKMVAVLMALTLIVSITMAGKAYCALDSKVGTTSASFLKIGIGARAAGMGEAFGAVADDVTAMYWNPAGVAQIEQTEATFMHSFWLESMSYEYLGLAYPLGGSAIGISVGYLGISDIEGRDVNDVRTSNFSANDMAIGVTYGKSLSDVFMLGGSIKSISEKIDTETASTVGLDVGALYKASEDISLAAGVQNVGSGLKFISEAGDLPMNVKVGGAYKSIDKALTIAMDVNKPVDNKAKVNLGMEYWFKESVAVRGGYKYQMGGNDSIGGLTGLTAGAGLKVSQMQIDYAFMPFGDLGSAHRVSLLVKF